MTIKSPRANDLLFPGERSVRKTLSVFACYQAFRLTDSKKNVYMDNHSGISSRKRDSNVSMTNLVSAEDDVNLRMSTGLSPAIDEGRRRRRYSLRAIRLFDLQTAKTLYG